MLNHDRSTLQKTADPQPSVTSILSILSHLKVCILCIYKDTKCHILESNTLFFNVLIILLYAISRHMIKYCATYFT